jgi:hypothetical protein
VELSDFHQLHAGQTCLFVGNGPNLHLTPPEWFNYPSFGVNTCHLWPGTWKPTYYTGVDHRLFLEFGEAVYAKFRDIPKFIPQPKLNIWQGENFYRWLHRPGEMITAGHSPADPDALTCAGIAYRNITHVALQLAWYMGFTTVLMIGVQHGPANAWTQHFWGNDERQVDPNDHNRWLWLEGYKILTEAMKADGVTVLNISEDTHVPAECLPRGDWREWSNSYESNNEGTLPGRTSPLCA